MKRTRKVQQRGSSLIEFVLVAPWYFLLFSGVLQAGFAICGLIAVQNAARVAALHLSANPAAATDQPGACTLAIKELKGLPNTGAGFTSDCNASPLTVTVKYCDAAIPCTGSATSIDGGPAAFVRETYNLPTVVQFPIAGLPAITRTMEMRLRDPLP